ncbi:Na+/H+ antiporter subunit E [Streptomyces gobiensis]|uniref:Na+/H+ antiporter subunit E n=1 Tax=Streptomyces gobiensis TaxID=2875706 RepID=UPI001E2E379B|nr:Na+/H+ antiporter subunit E [Streptomyces gobiensis]UGY94552.1 Na+/H+ antiporter subunit E [Streptomyces gobiensis]
MSTWIWRAAARTHRLAAFLGYFSYRFIEANLIIAWEILSPGRLAPAIVELPLRCRTRGEIVVLASLISLTPSTLMIEVRTNPPILYVYGTHADDVDSFRRELRKLETSMLAAMRPTDDVPGVRRRD